MPLTITSIIPTEAKNDVPIDSSIIIEVSEEIDVFSVANGITLYTESRGILNDKDLIGLDTKYTEILDIGEVNTPFPFGYQVNGNTIEITPTVSLIPDTTFYVDIFPGNDVTRYLSKKTVGNPLVISESGIIGINSSYTGSADDTFEITFSSSDGITADTVDVAKGITQVLSTQFESDKVIDLGELKITLDGTWDVLDSISIPVFKASGPADLYRTNFTTSKYTTISPKSNKIEYVSDTIAPFNMVSTTPEDMSIGNQTCNPIVIKFNKALKQDQNLTDKIKIKRVDFNTGITKNINQYFKIEGDTVKIYMISVSRV